MISFQNYFLKCFYSTLIVISIILSNAVLITNQTDVRSFDFEQVKNDLFLKCDFKNPNEVHYFKSGSSRQDSAECINSLNEIKNGLTVFDDWALKLVDSWGKFPSAILAGNLFEFGGFSECFNIERNDEIYDTQYCMGSLILNIKGFPNPKSFDYEPTNIPMPNFSRSNDDPTIQPRIGIRPPVPSGGLAITFGMCLPESCPTDVVESYINNAIPESLRKNVSVRIPANTCQTEEIPYELEVLDIVTIVIIGIVLILVLASTAYDILYTLMNVNRNELFVAFSVYTNGAKLLSIEQSKSPDQLHCIHGIRVITTGWVVLGHTFLMYILLPIRNQAIIPEFASKYHNMVLLSAFVSVDTFFLLSGLFASISMLKVLQKTKGRLNIPMMYLHRYLRLTPLLIIGVLVSMSLLRFLGSGPLFPNMMKSLSEQCERNWWQTLLYVQNYVNPKDICFGHSWYLSVDMQLFWTAPFLAYLIYFFQTKALFVLSFAILGCIGCTISTYMTNDLAGFKSDMASTYYPTHLRFNPWLIGMIFGALFHEARKKTIRIPTMFNIFAWAFSLVLMATVIFANYPLQQWSTKHTPLEYAVYDSLSRVAWSIALCWVIFACVNNYGGPVNWFLGHPLWQPLSRLCYAVYIVHFSVIMIMQGTIKSSGYFSELNAFHFFIGNFVLSVCVALIASLAFGSPMIIIEKVLFGPQKRPQRSQTATEQNVASN